MQGAKGKESKERKKIRRQVRRQGADALLKMLGVENDPRMKALVVRALQTNSASTVAELASMISEAQAAHQASEAASLREAPPPTVSAEDAAVTIAGPSAHPLRNMLRERVRLRNASSTQETRETHQAQDTHETHEKKEPALRPVSLSMAERAKQFENKNE